MHSIRALLPVFALLAAPLAAQVQFRADLNGAQEVPPVNTDAKGWGEFTLNADDSISYTVRTYGLVGTAAHIHMGAPGVNGSILFTLAGGPSDWEGRTVPLTAGEVADLRAGNMYVNVHTSAHPNGAIRGQLEARPLRFGARLNGRQEVPPVSTNAMGVASFEVNPDQSITYDVRTSGLSATAAHIHTGKFGTNGGILFTLQGGPTEWTGRTAPMTNAEFTMLQENGLYVNVHTNANPNGEIRGQIVSSGVRYGYACPWNNGSAELFLNGAPYAGETIQVNIRDGVPNGKGMLVASLKDVAVERHGCGQLIGHDFRRTTVQLNRTGNATFPMDLPMLPGSVDVYIQFGGRDNTGAWYSTNGVCVPIVAF
ncbi:MAG: CHRD domain-containing protein [Planctomycetota bacterium]|nr:MAG: CHRD domain-containing protein [Planctomycetota bacterium]